mmetsp:Transcript_40985/g.64648  ORF Transcript_40985/g.64648 Transcript_40985/m.64648 type:complete len:138 (+) Transcript_40985:968-1381(+)
MRYLWETGVKPLFAVVSLRPLVDHRAPRASRDTCEVKLCLRRNEQSEHVPEHVPWMCPHPSHSKEAAPRPACEIAQMQCYSVFQVWKIQSHVNFGGLDILHLSVQKMLMVTVHEENSQSGQEWWSVKELGAGRIAPI